MPYNESAVLVRLAAAEAARQYVIEAVNTLASADVRNVEVTKAVKVCLKALTDYRHTTQYTIDKRRERTKKERQCRPSISW